MLWVDVAPLCETGNINIIYRLRCTPVTQTIYHIIVCAIAQMIQAGQQGLEVRFPKRLSYILSSPQGPDQFWSPHRLTFEGFRGYFTGPWREADHLHLLQSSRIRGTISPLPTVRLHGMILRLAQWRVIFFHLIYCILGMHRRASKVNSRFPSSSL